MVCRNICNYDNNSTESYLNAFIERSKTKKNIPKIEVTPPTEKLNGSPSNVKTSNQKVALSEAASKLFFQGTDFKSNRMTTDKTKPPPIYLRNFSYNTLKNLNILLPPTSFRCIKRFNHTKIITETPEAFSEILKYLKTIKADYHTFQMYTERAQRVVIRNLDYRTPLADIKKELENAGYQVRNVINARHPLHKELPMRIFFVDLEPSDKNKEIFSVKTLLNTSVVVEEPRGRRGLLQCHRCQEFGHSRSYCSHPPRCVRCGEEHSTSDCDKPREEPAKCALCGSSHPANYRGCPVYKELLAKHPDGRRISDGLVNRKPSVTEEGTIREQEPTIIPLPSFSLTDNNLKPKTTNDIVQVEKSLMFYSLQRDLKNIFVPLFLFVATLFTDFLPKVTAIFQR